MRCLALAQAWRDNGGKVVFATAQLTPGLRSRLENESIEICDLMVAPGGKRDLDSTLKLARVCVPEAVVVDGYHFGGAFQSVLVDAGFRVLFIDDYGHASKYSATWVLNQNISAYPELYKERYRNTRLLLGPKYALLRREFVKLKHHKPIAENVRKILITMGASDPQNATLKILSAMRSISSKKFEIEVIVGGDSPNLEDIQNVAESMSQRTDVLFDVKNMYHHLKDADIVVTAGGSTCWEAACLGLPNIILTFADNQVAIAQGLERAKAARNLGRCNEVSQEIIASTISNVISSFELRNAMSYSAQSLVDGKGAHRVLGKLNSFVE